MLINRWQTTLQKAISFTGKGLHSGRVVRMSVKPSPVNNGIRFFRTESGGKSFIQALAPHISSTYLCTSIGDGACTITSVEHLLAAFAGLSIRNADVFLDAPEVPIMDGSPSAFVRGFLQVGIIEQNAPAVAYRLKRPYELREEDRILRLEPCPTQSIICSIDFRTPLIGRQVLELGCDLDSFLKLVNARTFCHTSDILGMREQGLALGGSLDNALVVSDQGILNAGGLRVPDEFVRHKIIDLIGDLSLIGAPLVAKIFAHKTGHRLHAAAAQAILSEKDRYLEEFYPTHSLFPLDTLCKLGEAPLAVQYA